MLPLASTVTLSILLPGSTAWITPPPVAVSTPPTIVPLCRSIWAVAPTSVEHTSELQAPDQLVCPLLPATSLSPALEIRRPHVSVRRMAVSDALLVPPHA